METGPAYRAVGYSRKRDARQIVGLHQGKACLRDWSVSRRDAAREVIQERDGGVNVGKVVGGGSIRASLCDRSGIAARIRAYYENDRT
jgi:hypothetical protein